MTKEERNVHIYINGYATHKDYSIRDYFIAKELVKKEGTKEHELYNQLQETVNSMFYNLHK